MDGSGEAMAVVLVVDDDDDIRDIIEYCLRREGHTVTAAEHGQAALAVASRQAYDLAILDWSMPHMNGGQLCARLHELPHLAGMPVVILTAHGDAETRLSAKQAGAAGYLTKPFTLRALADHVGVMLDRGQVSPSAVGTP